jgi:CheY-like chemotaxis protein
MPNSRRYSSAGADARLAEAKARVAELELENGRLRSRALSLELDRRKISETSMIDQASGFRNEKALHAYLAEVLALLAGSGGEMALILYELDDAIAMLARYGDRLWDEGARRAGALLRAMAPAETIAFKAGAYRFAFMIPGMPEPAASDMVAESLGALESMALFEERISARAVVEPIELWTANASDWSETAEALLQECDARMRSSRDARGDKISRAGEARRVSTEPPFVLVVEPDSFNAVVVMDLLSGHGLRCEWFRDGPSALERMKEAPPAVVVSALSMPRMSGLELRRKMQEEGRLRGLHDVHFVLLAERKNDSLIRLAADLGISHYLGKPYFLAELLAIVAELTHTRDAPTGGVASCN